ncbi:siderophore-interacting protein (plasmid) [Diaphorobacter sp. HDW4B]|uniref:siderophore-interacting protein n=1 Tax=Diaphorobacter sp. HDW4B TaxID=2714925 RepID=UPI00140A2650|nr:siderophore-interacting protein [Diaphorobacter sp. HDW4B]QIL74354.1 siderophore-interacting protein [Diaphorobacter sp. HDW4B]
MNSIAENSKPLTAQITLPRAAAFVEWLVDHWRDKGVEIRHVEPERVQMVLAEVGMVELQVAGARKLGCAVQTVTLQMGELMQLSLTEHLGEFADEMDWPDGSWNIVWNGQSPRSPAQLHVMNVISNHALTPQMRRVRLQCDDLGAFANAGLHVRMLLPAPGHEPAWPTLTDDGRLQWPPGKPRMARRTYTIRDIDEAASWIDIDVLLHADGDGASPGSVWAENAQPGSSVGVLSPASGLLPRAAHYVLMADACALPAAARMAQMLPADHTTSLLLWVANDAERAAFDVLPTLVQPDWICAGAPGASSPEIARVLDWLARQNYHRPDTVLWVAGGLPLTQAVRRWLADQPALPSVRKMIHTYWR